MGLSTPWGAHSVRGPRVGFRWGWGRAPVRSHRRVGWADLVCGSGGMLFAVQVFAHSCTEEPLAIYYGHGFIPGVFGDIKMGYIPLARTPGT